MTSHAPRLDPATPLLALGMVSLDIETTGLNVAEDRIVQIGAVRMRGAEVLADQTFNMLVKPGVNIPEVASRIHGLTDADVADAPGVAEALARLAKFLDGAVVVGHSVQFDLAVLRYEAARHGVAWIDPPRWLDTELIASMLIPGRLDLSMEAAALGFGTTITGRHTAIGDAMAAAEILAAMLAPLRELHIRTLAELETYQRRPRELMARRERAGWFSTPGTGAHFAGAETLSDVQKAVDTFLYRHRLADVMGRPPYTIPPSATLVEAAAAMHDHSIGCLVVEPLAAGGGGFLSERDLTRALATKGAKAGALQVSDVMTPAVISVPEVTPLYRALGLMARRNLRSLVATGPDGAVSGVFTLRALLRERALAALSVGDGIDAAENSAELAEVQAELPGLAAALLADGLEAPRIAAIISAEGRAMTARAGELAEQRMVSAGRGAAPATYCLLVLGSGGRGESLLAPDQDNAVIVDDSYEGDLDSPEDWFTLWGGHLNRILDEAGIPLCKGKVMVRERAWRRTLSEWTAHVDGWVANAQPASLLNADIFYDFVPVLGDTALAVALREHAVAAARDAPLMIKALTEATGVHGQAAGAIGGLMGGFKKDERGRTDLKEGGLLALVTGARAMALAFGIEATATPERLTESNARAGLGGDSADAKLLIDIHAMVLRRILEQQIDDIRAGIPPTSAVDTGAMGRDERKVLKQAIDRLAMIDEMVRAVLK